MSERQPPSVDKPQPAPQRRSRRRWRYIVAATLLLILLHGPLLRAVGRALMSEAARGEFDAVVLLGGDHRLQMAVEMIDSQRVRQVWLLEGRPDFLVTAGILPSDVEVMADRLIESGVAEDRIVTLSDPEVDDLPDAVRLLGRTLAGKPDVRLVVSCGALSGRHVRFVLDDVLDSGISSRVAVLGLPYDRFNLQQWWRSRSGLKQVFSELCTLGFTLVVGTEPREPPPLVDPQAIEAHLRQRYGEAACYAR